MVLTWGSGKLEFQTPLSVRTLYDFFTLLDTKVGTMIPTIGWNGRELQFPSLHQAQKAVVYITSKFCRSAEGMVRARRSPPPPPPPSIRTPVHTGACSTVAGCLPLARPHSSYRGTLPHGQLCP